MQPAIPFLAVKAHVDHFMAQGSNDGVIVTTPGRRYGNGMLVILACIVKVCPHNLRVNRYNKIHFFW